MFERYCVNEDYTIKEVLEQFESSNDRVALVENTAGKIVGVVSQGDILRSLSAGGNIYAHINQIIKNSFLHLYTKDMEEAYRIFKKKKITLLPVIDYEGRLSDVITLDDIFDYLESRKQNIC